MSKFIITIITDNDAFGDDDFREAEEVSRILKDLAGKLHMNPAIVYNNPTLRDINGNTVGQVIKEN